MKKEEAIRRLESMRKSAVAVMDSGFGTRPGESDLVYRKRKELAEFCLFTIHAQSSWISVNDRLPVAEYEDHQRKWGSDPEFIVVISGAKESAVLHFGKDRKGRYIWYDEDTTYRVSHWMNWPTPPVEELP